MLSQFRSSDQGFWQTASINSDGYDVVDWETHVQEKQNFNNPYIDSEANGDNAEPLRKRFKSK